MSHISLVNTKKNPNSPLKACNAFATDICGKDTQGCGWFAADCCSISDSGTCGVGSYDCTDANGKK